MKIFNKKLNYILFSGVFIFMLLAVNFTQAAQAPDELGLKVGSYVRGTLTYEGEPEQLEGLLDATGEIRVSGLWTDEDTGLEVYEISQKTVYSEAVETNESWTEVETTSLIFKENRSVIWPALVLSYKNSTDYITVSIDHQHDLGFLEGNIDALIIIEYNGIKYNASELDSEDPNYEFLFSYYFAYALANVLMLLIEPVTTLAVSPATENGQDVQYGIYSGQAVSYETIKVKNKNFDTVKVHIEAAIIEIEGITLYISESYRYYERNTGLIIQFSNFDPMYNLTSTFTPTKVHIAGTSFLPLDMSWLIALPILGFTFYLFKKRK